jgi:hypothetical protein
MCSLDEQDADTDRTILMMLLADPVPWKTEEVLREMANPVQAEDGLGRLHAAGLIHRIGDGFVFPTRAAARANALGG